MTEAIVETTAPVATPEVVAAPAPVASESLLPPVATPSDDLAWLPEKYRVNGSDGKLDLGASSKKLADGYSSLSKRLGGDSLPPATASDYKFTPPDEYKDLQFDDTLSANFRERAHKAGLSQGQYEFVMTEYLSLVPEVLNSVVQATAAEARAELSKVWQTPAIFEQNINNGARAIAALPASLQGEVQARFGRDPLFLQAIAHYGAEMREDRSPANADGGNHGGETLEQIMSNPAYRDPKHPEHANLNARAQALAKRMAP